jgi:ABC-2 type transport system permease protein
MLAAFEMTIRQSVIDGFFIFGVFLMPLIYAVLGLWMLRDKGGDYAIFVVIGSGLAGLWTTMLFSSGNSISGERWMGTLEALVGAPTPLVVVVFGKNLANVLQSVISMVGSYALVSILFGYPLSLTQPGWFAISLLLGLISLVSFGMILAPAFIINPQVQQFQNAMEYPVYILSGFLFPIALLPGWTTPFSYILAPYWAARVLHATSHGGARIDEIVLCWVMMIILTVVYILLASSLFRVVLRKARVDATLARD